MLYINGFGYGFNGKDTRYFEFKVDKCSKIGVKNRLQKWVSNPKFSHFFWNTQNKNSVTYQNNQFWSRGWYGWFYEL